MATTIGLFLVISSLIPLAHADSALRDRMSLAMRDRDLAAVQSLVKEGVDPLEDRLDTTPQYRSRDTFPSSWLYLAAQNGDEAVFNFLLAPSENRLGAAQINDLYYANAYSRNPNRQILETLVAKGADTTKRFAGHPPLQFASGMGRAVFVRFLMDKGHDINERAYPGARTALSESIGCTNDPSQCEEVFKILFDRGARVTLEAFERATQTAERYDEESRHIPVEAQEAMMRRARAEEARCRADAGMAAAVEELAVLNKRLSDFHSKDLLEHLARQGSIEDAGCVVLLLPPAAP